MRRIAIRNILCFRSEWRPLILAPWQLRQLSSASINPAQLHIARTAATTHKHTPQRPTACWNCQKPLPEAKNPPMICAACGHLQDVAAVLDSINYFQLLSCPETYNVETQELTKHFRQLQAIVHPDKFSNKSTREQDNSADWSSLINKAYKTLSVPIERGQYMLKLHGEHMPKDNSALNEAFLMEMMERNEEVDEAASAEALQRLNDQIVQELNEKVANLSAKFAANALEAVKATLVEMKYLLSMQATIKRKQQALMSGSL